MFVVLHPEEILLALAELGETVEDGGLAAAACRGTLSCAATAATPARPDLCPAAAA